MKLRRNVSFYQLVARILKPILLLILQWVLGNAAYMAAIFFYVSYITQKADAGGIWFFLYGVVFTYGIFSWGGIATIYYFSNKLFDEQLSSWQRQIVLLRMSAAGVLIIALLLMSFMELTGLSNGLLNSNFNPD